MSFFHQFLLTSTSTGEDRVCYKRFFACYILLEGVKQHPNTPEYNFTFEQEMWVTDGGLLFFGKPEKIQEYRHDFRIEYLEVEGKSYSDSKVRYKFRLDTEDNLFNYFFEIFERLKKQIDIPFKLKGISRDENPAQLIAIREALLN